MNKIERDDRMIAQLEVSLNKHLGKLEKLEMFREIIFEEWRPSNFDDLLILIAIAAPLAIAVLAFVFGA